MDKHTLRSILEEVASGTKDVAQALSQMSELPFADLGVAKHDTHRPLRNGFSEVILCEGKRADHIVHIVREMVSRGLNVLGTRASDDIGAQVTAHFKNATYDPVGRVFNISLRSVEPVPGKLAIVCAGTADTQVAEEARQTALFFGSEASTYYDVGVAGLHRLMGSIDKIKEADVVIAIAGMEGALPSVLGGLVSAPIVAVPTSTGYGVNFKGVTALFAMLNSCSEGITVVNIDNGFGAACAALRILKNK